MEFHNLITTMMNREVSASYGSTRRSRSRSRSRTGRSTRARATLVRVPRSVGYSGNCKFTRCAELNLTIHKGAGFLDSNGTHWVEIFLDYSSKEIRATGDGVHFSSGLVPNYTEIPPLWDQLKIDKVELLISANVNDHPEPTFNGDAPSYNAPRIFIANDEVGPPEGSSTTTTSVRQHTGCQMYNLAGDKHPVKWSVKPKYQKLIAFNSFDPSTVPSTGYFDAIVPVPHYGTRIGLANHLQCGGAKMSIFAKFYFSAKSFK